MVFVRFSKSKFLSENVDLSFMTLAEQIYKDYLDALKYSVVPKIEPTHKLKLREIRVLMSLGNATSDVSASELAEQLRVDPSTITRSLVILVRSDFIEIYENEADGRSKMIRLTEHGQNVAKECHEVFKSFLTDIDSTDGLQDSTRADDVYVERMTDISKRAAFVLRCSRHRK